MGRAFKDGGLLPVDGVWCNHAHKVWHNISVLLSAEILAGVRVVYRNRQSRSRNLEVAEVFQDVLVGFGQKRAVEGSSDWQESVHEAHFTLSERNAILVQASRSLDLSQA